MPAKHTPGPWFVMNGHEIYDRKPKIEEPAECISATFRVSGCMTREANARLIAAAPELLEACESMITAVMKISAYNIQKFGMFPEVDRMNAAIAKAKGETCQ